MIIVAISIDELLQVVKDLKLAKQPSDALVAGRENAEPGDQFTDHGLIDTLFGEEPLRCSGSYCINLELLLVLGVSGTTSSIRHCGSALTCNRRVSSIDLWSCRADEASTKFRR